MYIIFDIGGTKMRVASALSSDNFNDPIILDTPLDYITGISQLKETIGTLSKGGRIQGIVGGIAGRWNEEGGCIDDSGNLASWDNFPIRKDLAEAFVTTVRIDNDAAMVGLGEAHFGAGKGYDEMLYMTVSTGIGGAFIEHGKLKEKFEPRQQVVDPEGNTLGRLISGKAVEMHMGMLPKDINDPEFWQNCARILAQGLAKIVAERNVDCIVIGGSMMNAVGISIDQTSDFLEDISKGVPMPVLEHSLLGDLGGLYGALAVIRTL